MIISGGLAGLAKLVADVDRRRPVPKFAPMTLQEWWRRRGGTANPHGRRVVLFPDTFNNHLHTDVGVACVEAIEASGWQVVMPEGHVCCGRPLYDYGFLGVAERYLRGALDALRDEIRAGTPVVGMEPSCVAVFKDELKRMLPHDNDAARLSQSVYHFPEFFDSFGIEPSTMDGAARMWGHCHQRATGGMSAEQRLLEKMGLDVDPLSGGCCGLAGGWGFEDGKYDISMDCGEQALLPAVRGTDRDTLIVADGFSCGTQIEHARTKRRSLHVAQVMAKARGGVPKHPKPPLGRRVARVTAVIGAAGVGAAVAAAGVRQRMP